MSYTTKNLVSNVVYGTPSGNYDGSSLLWYSNAVPAANYYGGQGSLQTITYNTANCTGIITMQATLNDLTEQAHWFDIDSLTCSNTSGITSVTVTGNFVWLRAQIENFAAGNITAINVAY
jgi:hypothetical protein